MQALTLGHQPGDQLPPQDEALFRSFQSNLLSLISHELRTPLMGILNALGLLEAGGDGGSELSASELIRMARTNAQRLQQTLGALMDLAALDTGVFHARLREVDLHRIAVGRSGAHRSLFKDRGIELDDLTGPSEAPVLADPQKLGRALDLCFQLILPRAAHGTHVQFNLLASRLVLSFELTSGMEQLWDSAWTHSLAGYQGGVASPGSAFAGVMKSEQAFLTRMEEGLGSELLLIHEILKLHGGLFSATREGAQVKLGIELPSLSSEEGLHAVLASRAYAVSTELATVALILIEVPKGIGAEQFVSEVRKTLFRASDSVYSIPSRGQAALVLDDCKPEDAPRLMERLVARLRMGAIRFGTAQCPADGLDPGLLLPLANRRLCEI